MANQLPAQKTIALVVPFIDNSNSDENDIERIDDSCEETVAHVDYLLSSSSVGDFIVNANVEAANDAHRSKYIQKMEIWPRKLIMEIDIKGV